MEIRDIFWGGVIFTVVLVAEAKHPAYALLEHLHAEAELVQQLQRPIQFTSGSVSAVKAASNNPIRQDQWALTAWTSAVSSYNSVD